MNSFLNYIVEANLALLLFLLVYQLFLKTETNFRIVRVLMLAGVLVSVLFPLIHLESFQQANGIPSLGKSLPEHWLPEVLITDGTQSNVEEETSTSMIARISLYLFIFYIIGASISLLSFLREVFKLLRLIPKNKIRSQDNLKVIELKDSTSTFSFFNLIFIGSSSPLTPSERQQIIEHEAVHAKQWHSLDVVLISLLKILFWFNPIINTYKKIFVQLHEFEADARAVENQDVNRYCNLLARVALQSAGLSLGNHFNNSLTIKRIQMMRTIKSNIKTWKLVACFLMVPLVFIFVACQEQVADENIRNGQQLPAAAEERFELFKQKYPGETFIVEYNKDGDKTLEDLDTKYGKATHIENFTITVKDEAREFSMLQYSKTGGEDEVFTIVEQMPEYEGGFPALVEFIRSNMRYPEEAKKADTKGTVYVKFVVNTDGSITEASVIKGVEPLLDNEALRVVNMLPRWTPGKQNEKAVRTRFVLPIKFDNNNQSSSATADGIKMESKKMNISWRLNEESGKRYAIGKVLDDANQPLKGANILITGTTTGVSADENGEFMIPLPETNGKLSVSFVGYDHESLSF